MSNVFEGLDKVRKLMDSQDFLEGKGLSNELNIRIFHYDAKDEMAVQDFIENLKNSRSLSCNRIHYDLYDIFLDICSSKNIIKSIPAMEEKKGSKYLLSQLQMVATESAFLEKMEYEPHQLGDVVLISGVGKVFPFMRVHNLLNAMHAHFSDIPVLVMYPGKYDGRSMSLFNILPSNDYYRAFNVV